MSRMIRRVSSPRAGWALLPLLAGLTASLDARADDPPPPTAARVESTEAVARPPRTPASSAQDDDFTTFVERPGFTSADPSPIWSIASRPTGRGSPPGPRGAAIARASLRVWEIATGRDVYRIVDAATILPHRRIFARRHDGSPPPGSTGSSCSATPTTARSGSSSRTQAGINAVAFAPDGKTLATAGSDADGQALGRRHGQGAGDARRAHDQVNGVAFGPDGKTARLVRTRRDRPDLGRRDGRADGDPQGA